MKNMLVAFYSMLIGIIVILIGVTIYGRNTRQTELNNALKIAMEDAMVCLLYEEGKPETEEEWKAAFVQLLAIQINSVSDLSVDFLEANMEKGILSVEATLTWNHPIGTRGSVSNRMTAIIEERTANNGISKKNKGVDLVPSNISWCGISGYNICS